jgi:DNA-binding MarR family transcriptional regulator
MDKVSVGRAAQALMRRKLVRRIPHATDGRSHRLLLTRAGKRLYAQIVPLALDYETELLAGLQQRAVSRLRRELQQLEQAANQLTEGARERL